MLKDVVAVGCLGPCRLRLIFEGGVSGEVGVARLVPFEGVFAALRDPASFRAARVESEAGTVAWPSGADLGLSGFPCAGHDDGKEGTLAWHDAKPRSSPTSCSTRSLPAAIRKPPSAGAAL
jgi:hypothetical protein